MEIRGALFIFSLELEISRMAIKRPHEISEKWWLCEELLSENNFDAVLVTFCCFDYCVNPSETAQKMAADEKDDHKYYLYAIVS